MFLECIKARRLLDQTRHANLLLVFGARQLLQEPELLPMLRQACPAVHFAETRVKIVAAQLELASDSRHAGEALIQQLTFRVILPIRHSAKAEA